MLVKNTWDKINESRNHAGDAIEQNLGSGFEATGVHSCNPENVLNNIPNENNENGLFSADYENNLVAFPKEKRYNNTPVRGPLQKKKRLNIVAVRSDSSPESESENDDVLTNHREDTSGEFQSIVHMMKRLNISLLNQKILKKGRFSLYKFSLDKEMRPVIRT